MELLRTFRAKSFTESLSADIPNHHRHHQHFILGINLLFLLSIDAVERVLPAELITFRTDKPTPLNFFTLQYPTFGLLYII